MLPRKFTTNVALKMVVCTAVDMALGRVVAKVGLESREVKVEADMFQKRLPTM